MIKRDEKGRFVKGYKQSEEFIKKQRKRFLENNPMYNIKNKGNWKCPWTSERNKKQIGKLNPFYGKHHTEESKIKSSNTIIKNKSHTGPRNGNFGKGCHFTPTRVYYKNICFRSTWEVIFAKWLDKNKYTWKYEAIRFYFKNKNYSYLPDFYVIELDTYFEIKGYYRELCKEKIKQFRKFYPNLKLIVIDKDTIGEYKE